MSKWKDLEKELLSDPAVKKEYDKLAPRYAVISQLITARLNRGMTQKDIAEKLGTKQSAIARFESGTYNPTLSFVKKLTSALHLKIKVHV